MKQQKQTETTVLTMDELEAYCGYKKNYINFSTFSL